jgi:methylthioribose-1-phosphate isomerase
MSDGTLFVLDQRLLPDRVEEIACRRAADVAFQMRMLAVNGAPLLGQLAAYGFALTAAESRDWPLSRRHAELRRATQLLTYARPAARPVRAALARMEARAAELGNGDVPDGEVMASALMIEADAIATQAAIDHAAIARATATLLRPAEGAQLRVLVVGDPGLLTTGQVGTGITALRLLAQSGVGLTVFVAEGRPRLEGARLASWELRLAGIDHTVVGDSAVGWLMATELLDAVLMGADWIAANGDVVGTIGSRAVAELAALGLNDGRATPVYVLAPSVTIASELFAGGAIPVENRPGRELAADHAAAGHRGTTVVNPAVEVVPNERVSAFVTERGVQRAPFAALLSAPSAA